MKTIDTLIIEDAIRRSIFGSHPYVAKEYGTTEVTIGFQRDGKGKEIVDFMSYNPRSGNIKCFEIKVTLKDFHSTAKKSWYGTYNYLAITEDLYKSRPLDAWKEELPKHVGIVVVDTRWKKQARYVSKATKQTISQQDKEMLTDSLIRTLFYQNCKLREG